MSLQLLTTPNKIIDTLDSRAAGALLQLPYTFQRQDYIWYTNDTDGATGNFRILLSDIYGNVTSEFSPGDLIFVSFPDNYKDKGYPDVLQVLSLNYSAPYTRIVTTQPNLPGTPGAVVNETLNNLTGRANYKAEISLLDQSGNSLLDNVFRYAPDPAGKLFVNLGTVLSDYLFREQILSQVYKIAYNEAYEGLGPPVFFAGSGTAASGAILFILDPIYGNLSTQFVGQNIYLTCNEFTGWAPANSVSFGSGSTRVNFLQSDVNNVASLTGDIQTPAIGQPEERAVRLDSDTTQATFAAVGNYTEKGSNLVEYLLRVGGGTNINWGYTSGQGEQLPKSNNLPGDSCTGTWAAFGNGFTARVAGTETLCTKILNNGSWNTGQSLLKAGSFVEVSGSVTIQISAFVAAGDIRMDVLGIRADGSRAQLIVKTIFNVTGNVSQGAETAGRSFVTTEDFTAIGINFFKIGGDFTVDWIYTNGRSFELKTDYAPAKVLTQFKNPLQWKAWPRTCSYLIDPLAVERNNLTDSTRLRVNNYNINKEFVEGEAIVSTDLTPRIVTVAIGSFFPNNLAAFRGVFVQGSGSPRDQLTDILYYRILPECENPIMVEYYNQLGVPEQHLFNITQEIELQATEGTGVTTPVNQDLAGDYSRRIGRRLPDFTQQILCTSENLLPDQYLALQELIYSSEVFIYLDKEGTKKLPVILSGEPSTSKETKDKRLSLQVTLELPLNVRFEDIKLY